ncbi:Netrin-4 Beta-netrin [Collichthys lucidus]|uniref:Netrin-1 n=1 Tax=Collichthys lucidus TaxID=240159 RepID=A0A4U5U9H4_COLLU|nr:Netrin-4 Beta-netrin [Collichthys lucidus]
MYVVNTAETRMKVFNMPVKGRHQMLVALCWLLFVTRSGAEETHPSTHMTDDPFLHPDTWWASGAGTAEEQDEIRLDLETKFCLSHVVLVFRSPRPAAMAIERSVDFGKTWEALKLFAQNCSMEFGLPDDFTQPGSLCTSRYTSATPCSRGEVIVRTLDPSSGKTLDPYSPEALARLTLTNLRIRLLKAQTCPTPLNPPPVQTNPTASALTAISKPEGPACVMDTLSIVYHTTAAKTQNRTVTWCLAGVNVLTILQAITVRSVPRSTMIIHGGLPTAVVESPTHARSASATVTQTAVTSLSGHGFPQVSPAGAFVMTAGTTPSGAGCWCDPRGSLPPRSGEEGPWCHPRSGQCHCKSGVGGTGCSHCLPNYWDFGEEGCKPCTCPVSCDPITGQCLDSYSNNQVFNVPIGGKIPDMDHMFTIDEEVQWSKELAVSALHYTVIKASVLSAYDKGSHAEVQVKVRKVLQSGKVTLNLGTISIYPLSWTSRGCTCPILNPGMEYLLAGPEEAGTGRLLVTMQSVVVPWTPRLGLLISEGLRNGCP